MASAKSNDDSNPLRKLLNAEKEAATIISNEEKYRSKRLLEAEAAAQDIYDSRRAEEEAKFQKEVRETEGEGDEKLKQMLAQTEAEKKEQMQKFAESKESVVNLLLAHVGTCHITLDESQKQAFLAIARKNTVVASEE